MPTKTVTRKTPRPNAVKRHAKHHKVSKHYLKVYWPYVPMLLIVAVGLFVGSPREASQSEVLAYATEISNSKLLLETNERRIENGSKELTINNSLSEAAQAKANDMAQRNYWSHYTPEGAAPWIFIDKSGYTYTKAGENLAYGFRTSDDTIAGWMNSQTHRENMLDGSFSEVGFGFVNASNYNNSGQETIVVAMYGQPKDGQPVVASASGSTAAFSTSSAAEPSTQSVSLMQSLTGGRTPWVGFVIGLVSGALLLFLCIRHGLAFKRVLIHGEEFILKHPALDIVFVSFVMIGYVLSQTTGFIR